MRHAAARHSGTARLLGNVLHVRRAHDPLVVDADVHVELIEGHVLLGLRSDEVMELHAGDGDHGLAIHLGVVESIEQMNAAGAGGRNAGAQFAREFRPGAGHEGSRFLVSDLDESDALAVLP